jgi:hypothetical protein
MGLSDIQAARGRTTDAQVASGSTFTMRNFPKTFGNTSKFTEKEVSGGCYQQMGIALLIQQLMSIF